jgi:hypothetical protein
LYFLITSVVIALIYVSTCLALTAFFASIKSCIGFSFSIALARFSLGAIRRASAFLEIIVFSIIEKKSL